MFLLALAMHLSVLASDPTTVRGTTVITKSGPHEIVIAVDAAGDGSVDHLFRFWTEGEAPTIELSSRAAMVEYRGDELVVTAPDRQTSLTFTVSDGRPLRSPQGFSCTQMRGFGLNHETGPAVDRKRIRDDGGDLTIESIQNIDYGDVGGGSGAITCDSGGHGSSSCSITNIAGSCSTTCLPGYYACCKYGPENTCKCIKN